MSDVFISYRREDSAAHAGRICDRLESAFGSAHVFMDVEDIAPGMDFADAIDKTVGSCDVLLAVIGPEWVTLLRSRKGERDFVGHEISSALKRGVTVIPVLVGGATMPSESELPTELDALARRQAVSIRDAAFDQDAGELVRGIQRATGGGRDSRRLIYSIVAIGILIAIVGASLLLMRSRQQAALSGAWIVRIQRPGQRPFNIRLALEQAGKTLTGQVVYPTGSAAIEEGVVNGTKLSFFTRHTPQFETEPAKISFTGQVRGREVDLTIITPDGGVAKGTARKSE